MNALKLQQLFSPVEILCVTFFQLKVIAASFLHHYSLNLQSVHEPHLH